jgi:hypothetical protein
MKINVTVDGGTKLTTESVKAKLELAWRFVTHKAALHAACNAYFKSLSRKKTLQDVLKEGDIVLHCLWPANGHTFEELPDGDSAGRDLAIDPFLLLQEIDADKPSHLACTLILRQSAGQGRVARGHDDGDALRLRWTSALGCQG